MPTNPTSAHSVRFCGHFDRKTTARSTRTIDATANRRDADKNGGAPSKPIRIASHLHPQMRHKIVNAALRVGGQASGPGSAAGGENLGAVHVPLFQERRPHAPPRPHG